MPTFKHPCPYCGKFIDRAVAACPYCGVREPFSPKRCLACRKIVEDPAWTTCPSCGASLTMPVAGATPGAPGSIGPQGQVAGPPPAPAVLPAPSVPPFPAVPAIP